MHMTFYFYLLRFYKIQIDLLTIKRLIIWIMSLTNFHVNVYIPVCARVKWKWNKFILNTTTRYIIPELESSNVCIELKYKRNLDDRHI